VSYVIHVRHVGHVLLFLGVTSTHLHLDDAPDALAILAALLGQRSDHVELGYRPTEYGAEIDWDLLTHGKLSTTEVATVHIARGCAIAERHGEGLPPSVRSAVVTAVDGITGAMGE